MMVEEMVGKANPEMAISEVDKTTKRKELLIKNSGAGRRGEKLALSDVPEYQAGIEMKVSGVTQEAVDEALLSMFSVPDPDQQRMINEAKDKLIKEHNHCPSCADELMRYAARTAYEALPDKSKVRNGTSSTAFS